MKTSLSHRKTADDLESLGEPARGLLTERVLPMTENALFYSPDLAKGKSKKWLH